MVEPFQVLEVPADAARLDEQLGTKPKFWFAWPDRRQALFKRGRPNEDWSEKVGSDLAEMLGLPAAKVELASSADGLGVVSEPFLERDKGEILAHGNELLFQRSGTYPMEKDYHVQEHTLDAVFDVLQAVGAQAWNDRLTLQTADARDQFVGYILLDAWIGNTDRHHENWAVVRKGGRLLLAPTYDHASSLGIRETEARITTRLAGRDPRVTVPIYASRCRSAFYPVGGHEPMSTHEAFRWAIEKRPAAGAFWLERLKQVADADAEALLSRVPADRISNLRRQFAARILSYNRGRLLQMSAPATNG